jgi:hypothetical protein
MGNAHDLLHAFPFERQVFPDGTPYNYEPTIRSKDLVIVGSSVKITEPIYTNGGDIHIFAKELTIESLIDTRPYFTMKRHWHPKNSIGNFQDFNSFLTEPFMAGVFAAYDSVYFWSSVWDNQKKKQSYITASIPRTVARLQGEEFIFRSPQLPSALVPINAQNNYVEPPQGSIAPRVHESVRKSGSVFLYVEKISFASNPDVAPALPPTLPPKTLQPGTWHSTQNADWCDDENNCAMLQVSGVKGGRGGVGSGAKCGGPEANCWSSASPGLSGPPSIGGDAGDVHLVFIDSQMSEAALKEMRSAVERHIDKRPGYPAHLGVQRTAQWAQVSATATRGESSFQTQSIPAALADLEALGLVGRSGHFVSDEKLRMPLRQALWLLSINLRNLRHRRIYDFPIILEKMKISDGGPSGPHEVVESILADILSSVQTKILVAASQSGEAVNIHLPWIYNELRLAMNDEIFPSRIEQQLAGALWSFSDEGIKEFLRRNGGIVGLPENTANNFNQLLLAQLLIDLSSIAQEALLELTAINANLREMILENQRSELLDSVKKATQAANQAAKKFQDNMPDGVNFQKILENIGKAASDFYLFQQKIEKAEAEGKIVSFGDELTAVGDIAEALWGDFNFLSGSEFSSEDFMATRAALRDAVEALRMFDRNAADERRKTIAKLNSRLRDAFEADDRLRDARRRAAFFIGDLLRSAILTFTLRGIVGEPAYQQTILTLREIVDRQIFVIENFSLIQLESGCSLDKYKDLKITEQKMKTVGSEKIMKIPLASGSARCLTIINDTAFPVEIEFSLGQKYEFILAIVDAGVSWQFDGVSFNNILELRAKRNLP